MLKSQVEMINLEKLALSEKYDMLSYSHNELVDDHIMLDVAHEDVIANLNSCEPHSCTRVHLDNIIFICGISCLRSAGYFKTGTSIPLQITRRVFHSIAIQPSSRVRISSYKVIIIIRLFTHPPLGDIQILFPGIGNFQGRPRPHRLEKTARNPWPGSASSSDSKPPRVALLSTACQTC
jgi:hypothetical protein